MSENAVEETVVAEEAPVVEETPVVEEESPKPRSRRAKQNRENDEPETVQETSDRVVLFVNHPIHWPEVGVLAKGYNLLDRDVAQKWLDKGWAREASASEVAKAYGV